MKDRSRSDRSLTSTVRALDGAALIEPSSVVMATLGTDESVRPACLKNGLQTGFFRGEALLKFEQVVLLVRHFGSLLWGRTLYAIVYLKPGNNARAAMS